MCQFIVQSYESGAIDSEDISKLPDVVAVEPSPQTSSSTSFESAELAALDVIIKLASAGAITAAVNGIFNLLVERQKGRSQPLKIKAGEIELEIPAGKSPEDVRALVAPISAYLSRPRARPAILTIDAGK